jgi:phospholipid/cholesterol/gamma-HCH transport system substrate-binding protein
MVKETPTRGKLLAMAVFALSCVGILLFLWLSFGGSVPLQAKGYRFEVRFPEATQLAQEADVRISGVDVGKVRTKTPDRKTGLTDATIEIDSRYAPLPRDTRAILRQKTLLGETYVELTPGEKSSGLLPDGGTLAQAQVAPTVELDEIFRTFDPKTRAAFADYLDQQGRAVGSGGQQLNDALGNLTPFAENVGDVLRILHHQSGETRGLVRDTGVVFSALTERQGQLRSLVRNSDRVFATTAARDRELAATFVALPTFLRETRTTTHRLTTFANATNPLVTQLRPAARQLSPTLIDLKAIAPSVRGLFKDVGPLVKVSRTGLPALEGVLDDTRPLLSRTEVFLRDVQPIVDYLGNYKKEIAAFFSLDAAATQATDIPPGSSRPVHYLRTTNPVNPEVLAAYPKRLPTNRSNPYMEPGAYNQLAQGLPVFGKYLCQATGPPSILGPVSELVPQQLRDLIDQFVFTATGPVAPPCREQAALGRLAGQTGKYPQLKPLAAPTP